MHKDEQEPTSVSYNHQEPNFGYEDDLRRPRTLCLGTAQKPNDIPGFKENKGDSTAALHGT